MNKQEKIKQFADEILIHIREHESKINAIKARHQELLNKEESELEDLKLKHEALMSFK